MKKNNGSLQLWLLTITPILFAVCGLYDANYWLNQLDTATYFPNQTLLALAPLVIANPFVRPRLFNSEREDMNDAALKWNRYMFNIGWIFMFFAAKVISYAWYSMAITSSSHDVN